MTGLLALVGMARASSAHMDATVDPARHTITGTITFDALPGLVDPLALLPIPTDDRTLLRTFPGRVDRGEMRWTVSGNTVSFTTRLPERYGDVGTIAGDLWANGGWYPQPEDATVLDWDATVHVDGAGLGVLNGVVGDTTLHWQGTSDRLALAVLRHGVVERTEDGLTTLVSRHRRNPRLLQRLASMRAEIAGELPLVVVADRDLNRLVRPARGLLYLSERAFRMFPGLDAYHLPVVRRAIVASTEPLASGWDREFVATALTDALPAPSAKKLLGWFAWNPIVDALLHDGTLPFYADVFDDPFGGTPGLWEALDPAIPPEAAARQVDDLEGPGAAARYAHALLETGARPPIDAAPYPRGQDYRLQRGPDGLTVVRDAPPDAPPEVVALEVDGKRIPAWQAPPGPSSEPLGNVHEARIDPDGHVGEADRANDRLPARWSAVVSAGVDSFSPSQRNIDVEGDLLLRREDDTRWLGVGSISHDAEDLVFLELGVLRYLGPLVDRRLRQHRLYLYLDGALLDPAFRPTDAGAVALGSGVSYAWDTRTDDLFPVHGHRLSAGVSFGGVPASGSGWASASLAYTQVASPHPRVALVARGKAGWASGDVEHRLLSLGGAADVRGIPESAVLGAQKALGSAELRLSLLRNASVPLGVGWLAEVDLIPGFDAGIVRRDDTTAGALSASLGLRGGVDLLGARPTLVGVTVATPVLTRGFQAEGLQWYVELTHPF